MPPTNRYDGYWGEPTAKVDWCETNYEVSYYIAELWNTFSSLVMVLPPGFSLYQLLNYKIEMKITGCYIGVMCVGFGSFCFHMTLQYSMQLLDEIPMMWTEAVMIYTLLTMEYKSDTLLKVGLFLLCAVITMVYVVLEKVKLFQVTFVFMVVWIGYLMHSVGSKLAYSNRSIYKKASICYLTAALLWLLDRFLCLHILYWKQNSILPWLPIYQLHACWHVTAGTGSYLAALFIADTRLRTLGYDPTIKYLLKIWPYIVIDKRVQIKQNGYT